MWLASDQLAGGTLPNIYIYTGSDNVTMKNVIRHSCLPENAFVTPGTSLNFCFASAPPTEHPGCKGIKQNAKIYPYLHKVWTSVLSN